MSCSKDSTIRYMVDHMLVKPNMELYTPLPTTRLIDKIASITNLAKTKYGVDMGPLFHIRSRDITVGNYAILGHHSVTTKIRLEPNEPAFDAIDRSKEQEASKLREELRIKRETQLREEEGNYIISEEGDVVVPSNLPRINIKC